MTLYYYEEMTMREIGLSAWRGRVESLAGPCLGGGTFARGSEGSGREGRLRAQR